MTDAAPPLWLVVEDGTEYLERFERFLGAEYRFVRVGDAAALEQALRAHRDCAGLLLDLDFRRAPAGRLIDENGATSAVLSPDERRRRGEIQGILLLRRARALGCTLPALLFADIDDTAQSSYLERTLAPLTLVSSRRSLRDIAALLGKTKP